VLFEKRLTVPDTYPLTLNALLAGCNQKTSRDPVMSATEAEVQAALDQLKRLSLVIESSGGRVMRYAENVKRVLEVPSESVALLVTLILRGPQTAGELRIHCERLQKFSDISAVEGFLGELAVWPPGALVVELPRQPGARRTAGRTCFRGRRRRSRWPRTRRPHPASWRRVWRSRRAEGRGRTARDELFALRKTVSRLCAELGVEPPQR